MRLEALSREHRDLMIARKTARIFLDGIEQHRVILADEEAGKLVRYATQRDGHFVMRADGELVMETLVGKVEIKIIDQPGASNEHL